MTCTIAQRFFQIRSYYVFSNRINHFLSLLLNTKTTKSSKRQLWVGITANYWVLPWKRSKLLSDNRELSIHRHYSTVAEFSSSTAKPWYVVCLEPWTYLSMICWYSIFSADLLQLVVNVALSVSLRFVWKLIGLSLIFQRKCIILFRKYVCIVRLEWLKSLI